MKNTKEKIIISFLQLWSQKGTQPTLEELAKSIGIKKSSLYSHFSGKNEIFKYSTIICEEINKKNSFKINFDKKATEIIGDLINEYIKKFSQPPMKYYWIICESMKVSNNELKKIFDIFCYTIETQIEFVILELTDRGKINNPIKAESVAYFLSYALIAKLSTLITCEDKDELNWEIDDILKNFEGLTN